MRRWAVVLSALTISLGAATTVAGTAANASNENDPYTVSDGHAQAGGMYGVVPARDSNAGRPGSGGSTGGAKLLSYHGGPVQTGTTTVQAIFWGPSWATYSGDKITGLQSEYGGLVGSSPYSHTTTEYANGSGVHVSPIISYNPVKDVVDTSKLTFSGAPTTTQIAQEVINAIGAGNIVAGGYYPVYVDEPRGSAGYCAWHSNGSTQSGTEFQMGFFFNLNNDPGCDPDQVADADGLRALANVTGHEFSEMVTDPLGSAWYDQRGQENADKCAWTFGGNEKLSNGSTWYIQGNWSNAAYNNNQGYTYQGTFYRGCIISS